jgi:hypothetical protein
MMPACTANSRYNGGRIKYLPVVDSLSHNKAGHAPGDA